MEAQGNKRVLSFEEFMAAGQDSEMGQMGMGEMPADSHGNQQNMMIGMGDSEPQINLEKEPEPETDLMMMDEPEPAEPAKAETSEEPVADEVAKTDEVEESASSWFTR